MSLSRLRTLFLPAALASLALLGGSLSLLPVSGIEGCGLCYSQRGVLGLYLLLSMCALAHTPSERGDRRYAWMLFMCAALGSWLAARQVWLQGGAWSMTACPAPVAALTELPVGQLAHRLLLGLPDCSPIRWSFLDLTLPEWSLLAFLALACLPLSYLLTNRFRDWVNEYA
ncbi:disulfide bond formation protein B [Pseudomonas sp. RP23018S]|uniref:disulfide bond formation protein B n=1 Tax=Pseudomonas sp. RP23018S TaxID=3096037 RepID=UPI002ACAF58E|nr:disulfide bond formation protein B [Pseudomonas sp. RP23018S]MDZ5604864.1 disulfide bond formation protein B [Pseudomonas sp. RP23018S]